MQLPSVVQQVVKNQGWTLLDDVIEIPVGDGRQQRVELSAFEHNGKAMLRALSRIGHVDSISQERLAAALRLNLRLAFGAFAADERDLLVVDTYLVQDADPAEVARSIAYIAEQADHYERGMFGTDVQ